MGPMPSSDIAVRGGPTGRGPLGHVSGGRQDPLLLPPLSLLLSFSPLFCFTETEAISSKTRGFPLCQTQTFQPTYIQEEIQEHLYLNQQAQGQVLPHNHCLLSSC